MPSIIYFPNGNAVNCNHISSAKEEYAGSVIVARTSCGEDFRINMDGQDYPRGTCLPFMFLDFINHLSALNQKIASTDVPSLFAEFLMGNSELSRKPPASLPVKPNKMKRKDL